MRCLKQLVIIISYKVHHVYVQKCSACQKRNVVRIQVKHYVTVNSLEIIWSSFSFLNFSKLLIKPIYVIKSLFYLFLYWFITLSYKLQEGTSWESRHSSMFFQSCRWRWNETSTRDFFKLSKKISTVDVFIILQLSTNDFRVTIKGGRQQYYKKLKQIRYFNVNNIAECWWEIFCTSKESIVNQSCSTQFPVGTFSQMALFVPWTTGYVFAICGKFGHM